MTDKLETMLNMQKKFQNDIGFDFDKMSEKEISAYVKEMMLWTIDEMSEALHELKHAKGWSKKYEKWDKEKTEEQNVAFKEEMIDAFHFFMNMLLAMKMDSNEIFDRYLVKNGINIKRQEEGY